MTTSARFRDIPAVPLAMHRRNTTQAPLVMISSYVPRKCGIATFTEEALEFVRRHVPGHSVHVITHLDGRGPDVHPIIDQRDPEWYLPAAELVHTLRPYAVHIQHEYGLYEVLGPDGRSDGNTGFLRLLELLGDYPTVVEPHTVHGRYKDHEDAFLRALVERCSLLLLKCDYQRWRMEWNFHYRPDNVIVVPHGARPDRADLDPVQCRRMLGLDGLEGKRVVGLVGWIQHNKRWDLVLDHWEELAHAAKERTGEDWMLLAAGNMRDPNDTHFFETCRARALELQARGLAHYFEFDPRGDVYYQVMGSCDVVALPSIDETQSGTLARIFALNRPYVTSAPVEGLTAQTLESEAGLLFTNEATLRRALLQLMCDASLRAALSDNAARYVRDVVSWDVVAQQYLAAYERANAIVEATLSARAVS
jgi:1,2-diacylglycerol 3-alpha-glucosyltransferase